MRMRTCADGRSAPWGLPGPVGTRPQGGTWGAAGCCVAPCPRGGRWVLLFRALMGPPWCPSAPVRCQLSAAGPVLSPSECYGAA